MAITMTSINGKELLKQLNLTPSNADFIANPTVTVEVKAGEVTVAWANLGSSCDTKIPAKLSHMTQLQQGVIGDLAKASLTMVFNSAIAELHKQVVKMTTPQADIKAPTIKVKKPGPAQPAFKEPTKAPKADYQPFAPTFQDNPLGLGKHWDTYTGSPMTDSPVSLLEATSVLQPVNGSSATSRYFFVAGDDAIKLAVRIQTLYTSFRLEGPKLGDEDFKTTLKMNGFDVYASYASMHVNPPTVDIAMRTVGSVIFLLGLNTSATLPDLKKIGF